MPVLRPITLTYAAEHFRNQNIVGLIANRALLITDRDVYYEDDRVMHVVGAVLGNLGVWSYKVVLELVTPPGADVPLFSQPITTAHEPVFELLLESSVVGAAAHSPFGEFRLHVEVADSSGANATVKSPTFRRVSGRRYRVSLPAQGVAIRVDRAPENATWPLTTGVPFPLSAIADPSTLTLVDSSGNQVPAQITPRAEWYPSVGGERSVKWVSLDFVGQCQRNRMTRYFLRRGTPPTPISSWVTETPAMISVDTGSIRFSVLKQGFNGLDWLQRKVQGSWRDVACNGWGPYLEVDAFADAGLTQPRRVRFLASNDPTANVELLVKESGPVKVTIRAEGDFYYATPAGGAPVYWAKGPVIDSDAERRLCRYVIHITSFRGSSQVRISYRTIITYDPGNARENLQAALTVGSGGFFSDTTEQDKYLGAYREQLGDWWKCPVDIGWDWGITKLNAGYFGFKSDTGPKVWEAKPWDGASISLHQLGDERCSVVADHFDGFHHDIRRIASGIRSEGWITADLSFEPHKGEVEIFDRAIHYYLVEIAPLSLSLQFDVKTNPALL